MTASRIRIAAVALLIAPVVGACGSGGDDGRLTGAKGQWAAQVDPICADLQGKIGQLGENPEQQAKDVEDAVMRIRSNPYPRDDDQRAALFIAAMENLYLSLQDVHQSRLVNDQPRAQRALEGAQSNAKRAADAAKLYGLVECAEEL
ncbi:MAG TPA: hypothetical protein VM287_13055 [Egibacteraceae bacterium]|nr:hypothetical protein [Egibacteraceae bacterium]HWI04445.1 hypothetical protein [Acidimicrobiales bacterium]